MARYPVGLYPDWLRLVLTWWCRWDNDDRASQALTGELPVGVLIGSVVLAAGLFAITSAFFRFGLRRYASASS